MILLSNSTISFVFNNEVMFFFKSMKLFANKKFSSKKFKTKVVNFKYIRYDPFFNVNTIDDLEKAKIIYEKNFMES